MARLRDSRALLVIVVVILVLVIVPERVVEQLLALLADDGLLVPALDVVPLDSVLQHNTGQDRGGWRNSEPSLFLKFHNYGEGPY